MQATGRLFLCAHRRDQVFVCRRCDRGQRYCDGCTEKVRRARVREAGRTAINKRQGRFAHAERARRYRARRKNVTHQGSPAPVSSVVLTLNRADGAPTGTPAPFHCHRCAVPLPPLVRTGPLQRRGSCSTYHAVGEKTHHDDHE